LKKAIVVTGLMLTVLVTVVILYSLTYDANEMTRVLEKNYGQPITRVDIRWIGFATNPTLKQFKYPWGTTKYSVTYIGKDGRHACRSLVYRPILQDYKIHVGSMRDRTKGLYSHHPTQWEAWLK